MLRCTDKQLLQLLHELHLQEQIVEQTDLSSGGFLTILDDETSLFNLLRHSTRSTASWFILFFPLQALNCYCKVELRFFFSVGKRSH